MLVKVSVIIFTVFSVILVLFQAGLAAGLPWGAASMGGKFPGRYPPKMRVTAVINMLILAFTAVIVLSRAGLFPGQIMSFSRIAVWFVAGFYIVSTILNTITPSRIERIWAPVALIQAVTVIIIAVSQAPA